MTPEIIRTLVELRSKVAGWKAAGESVAVVPTMGALHQGHLSLVRAAKEACDRVIVTIFINPKQFNNPDDYKNYPRTEEEDARKLIALKADVVYVPDGEQMYPNGFATTVSVEGITQGLCGAHRAGHFDGVATIVTKLFTQTQADKAFFGEKDYQQLQVVTRLARDLDLPIGDRLPHHPRGGRSGHVLAQPAAVGSRPHLGPRTSPRDGGDVRGAACWWRSRNAPRGGSVAGGTCGLYAGGIP